MSFTKAIDNLNEVIKGKSILVVDDNQDMIHLYKRILTQKGYNVISAENGYDGVKMAIANHPDLIVLDLTMPGMDGYEVCRKLKESDETTMIPVIMVTCKSDLKDKIQGLETGVDDYLTKPINNSELIARVASLLKIKELNKRLIDARKLETLAQVAVSVNHEINNPLCSISANAEMLKALLIDSDEKVTRKIDIILKEVYRIKQVVSQLNNATRVVSTEYIPGVKMINLHESSNQEDIS